MDRSKKKGILIFVIVVLVVVIALIVWKTSSTNTTESNFIKQGHSWESNFVTALDKGDYIGDDIAKDLMGVDVKSWEDNDGSTGFIAAKNDTNGADIHNIQYSVKDDALLFYHYKNYSFNSNDSNKIDETKASEVAKAFADEFIAGGDKLDFKNTDDKQIKSLYAPNKVETWHAKDGKGEYYIVIDMEKGNVVYYCSSEYEDIENL